MGTPLTLLEIASGFLTTWAWYALDFAGSKWLINHNIAIAVLFGYGLVLLLWTSVMRIIGKG